MPWPASRAEADALLRDWAERLVQAHLATREDQDFALSQKSMIGQTMREYCGRFLFELIQNVVRRAAVGQRERAHRGGAASSITASTISWR